MELICNEIELVDGELVSGHFILFYIVSGSQTSVGKSENYIEFVNICDQSRIDVTNNYVIKFEIGRLKVTYS